MDHTDMTKEQFEKLPRREWDEDIGTFDSLVILPAKIDRRQAIWYNIRKYIADRLNIGQPYLYEVGGVHDSGYRCMDFVAIKDGKAYKRLSGCSDVIHFNGIGGYGKDWLKKHGDVPRTLPVIDWSIDCLLESGLLHIFVGRGKLSCGAALSSFDLFAEEK